MGKKKTKVVWNGNDNGYGGRHGVVINGRKELGIGDTIPDGFVDADVLKKWLDNGCALEVVDNDNSSKDDDPAIVALADANSAASQAKGLVTRLQNKIDKADDAYAKMPETTEAEIDVKAELENDIATWQTELTERQSVSDKAQQAVVDAQAAVDGAA